MEFKEWFNRVAQEAYRRDVLHLIGDLVSHHEAFDDGLSPADEVQSLIDAAAASQ